MFNILCHAENAEFAESWLSDLCELCALCETHFTEHSPAERR